VFDNNSDKRRVLVKDDSIDGTDFTITDAPMEVAEFDPMRTFEERKPFRVESEYKRSKHYGFFF
jgi:hypothetical protein